MTTHAKVYIQRENCPSELWTWLRERLRIPDDKRPFIVLFENSDLIKEFRHKFAAKSNEA